MDGSRKDGPCWGWLGEFSGREREGKEGGIAEKGETVDVGWGQNVLGFHSEYFTYCLHGSSLK